MLWFFLLRAMSRRTNEWVASFAEEARLTGEKVIRAPEAALYSGGTKPLATRFNRSSVGGRPPFRGGAGHLRI